jgi:uncharacterized protein YjdB
MPVRRSFMLVALALALVACTSPRTVQPTLQVVNFGPQGTDVAVTTTAFATFDRDVDEASLAGEFVVRVAGGGPVPGVHGYNAANRTATFTPSGPLLAGTTYDVTLSDAITGSGNAVLTGGSSWSFTTAGTTAPSVVSVTIPGGDRSVVEGGTVQVNAVVTATGGAATSVTWSSSDTTTATVSGSGLVTGVSAGTSTITATSTVDATKQASIVVTVTTEAVEPAVLDVQIDQSDFSVQVGATAELSATVSVVGGAAQTVTWSSSDEAVATVDASGVVTGGTTGEATITATSTFDTSQSGSVTVTVTPVPAVTSVTIEQENVEIVAGQSQQLTVVVEAVGGASTDVTWESDDLSVATVDADGNVTGVSAGVATITATSDFDDSKSASISVTVVPAPAVTSVSIDQADQELQVGATVTLSATVDVVGSASDAVVWESSNTAAATVDAASGQVTAVAEGIATITATSDFDDSKSDSITVTVVAVPAAVEFVGASSNSTSTTSLVISAPSGVSEGDLLIAQVTAPLGNLAVTAPGWTTRNTGSPGGSGGPITQVILTSVAGATVPAEFTFTLSTAAAVSGGVMAFRNADLPTLFPFVHDNTTTATASTATASAGSMFVTLFGTTEASFAAEGPIGMDRQYSEANAAAAGARILGATEARAAEGATGTRSVGLTPARRWVAHSIVVPVGE